MKLHSMSDFITNSSDETYIYTAYNAKEYVEEFLDQILAMLNLDGDWSDYFTINVFNESIIIAPISGKVGSIDLIQFTSSITAIE